MILDDDTAHEDPTDQMLRKVGHSLEPILLAGLQTLPEQARQALADGIAAKRVALKFVVTASEQCGRSVKCLAVGLERAGEDVVLFELADSETLRWRAIDREKKPN